ncbi:MAG: hypothetical protein A2044_05645 [Candidatus Firestonebacteria bacterium GWA2_43_8]|nr:MAG: hypothetical protein A2044_05645 [Candidatus Firestonebacteria bacterium GWA2_43_8]
MINTKTVFGQLLYSTLRLDVNGNVGTGYIFNFIINSKSIPVIITNKHVVQDRKVSVVFGLHLEEPSTKELKTLPVRYSTEWIFHPNPDVDLCCCSFGSLINQVKGTTGKDVFFKALTEDIIWDDNKLNELDAVEEIFMVGYPIGLYDQLNSLPLFRRGITASHPTIDFNGQSVGVIDCACYPGSSGSPILIVNQNGYRDTNGNFNMGRLRVVFLGTLFAGPQQESEGKIVVENIPMQQIPVARTKTMINLGYYVKSKELLVLKKEVENFMKANNIQI